MDRSANTLLRGLYVGVAYTLGSVASGFLYDSIGLKMTYQCLAIAAVTWSLIFVLSQRFKPNNNKKVRYARLLQAEEDQVTDDFESDDDWLQSALKHEK